MEDAYIIRGGKKIEGSVRLSGAKNVSLKLIIAALLLDTKVVLENVPRISDVHELIHLVKNLGVKADFMSKNTLEIDPSSLTGNKVDLLHASKTRVSFMLFAPLLHKFGNCLIPNPGGCRIGARPIDRIIAGMKKLGAKIIYNHETGYYEAKLETKPQGEYTFQKPTHTGTELLVMFSVFGKGTIAIINPAPEPEIDELIGFLNAVGANIRRKKDRILVKGVSKLKQKKPFIVNSDRNEATTFATLGLASKGSMTLENISPSHIQTFIDQVKMTGSGVDLNSNSVNFSFKGSIKPTDIETMPHPGFMTDWQPNWAVLMTQADGDSVIHERIHENRFGYVEELKKLGAKIEFVDPLISNPKEYYDFNYKETEDYQQAIRIHGGTPLHGGVLVTSDLRAGAALVVASLISHGESIVYGASIIDRGYEDFDMKLRMVGGNIKKV
ncbi:UDP-N-acetylglucosamine 1-carboxyvinyltransferase [Candidatus Roizmanbacteria bacterium]|nr:UDP-N-acetylglucosamine 1-carboxyvinyltransferase [Candidatus Roizmanbacteria bacterium]